MILFLFSFIYCSVFLVKSSTDLIFYCMLLFPTLNKISMSMSMEILTLFLCPRDEESGGILIYPCLSVRKQIHGLFGYLLPQYWSYSFNIQQDVYTHYGGVHVHRILIFFKYFQNDRQLDLSHFFRTSSIKGTWFVRLTPPTV